MFKNLPHELEMIIHRKVHNLHMHDIKNELQFKACLFWQRYLQERLYTYYDLCIYYDYIEFWKYMDENYIPSYLDN